MSLSETELNNISKWQYKVTDNSITTKFYKNFWYKCENYISPKISPNLISFTGFFLILSNFLITYFLHDYYPLITALYVIISTQIYCHLDAIDGVHARNTKTSSPLGELVDHICDTIGLIFIILSFAKIFNIVNIQTLVYTTLSGMLGFQFFHIKAYFYKGVEFGKYTGPIEILTIYCVIIFLKVINIIDTTYFEYINIVSPYLLLVLLIGNMYYMLKNIQNYLDIINNLVFLSIYFITMMSLYNMIYYYDMYYLFNICLNMCVLTCDFIISKMANKEINKIVLWIFIFSRFSNILGICLSLFYILSSLKSIANHMNLNIIYHNIK